ncbi:hypothetical protein SAMN02990966_05691 [Rhodospirillales bacterium URHD0017]|nr:hypothetical protein SAMN02990966_05691 [Rhodospirillales bacterium URHD0017]
MSDELIGILVMTGVVVGIACFALWRKDRFNGSASSVQPILGGLHHQYCRM